MFKRIGLFLLVNALIILTVSALLNFFGVSPYLTKYGLDYYSLALFCLIWGVAGSLISLMMSKVIAKSLLGVRIIKGEANSTNYRLVDMVRRLSERASLPKIPEVGIFESKSPNAFATGPSKKNALVAVSTGLLERMGDKELEAVLAHEIAHIKNGDMVTMTLLQGVINAFVMFLARVAAFAVSNLGSKSDSRKSSYGLSYYLTVWAFEIVFMLLGSIVICFFSRWREYRADRGGAMLTTPNQMISALTTLKSWQDEKRPVQKQEPSKALAALMIRDNRRSFINLFSTHPSLEKRIETLSRDTVSILSEQ